MARKISTWKENVVGILTLETTEDIIPATEVGASRAEGGLLKP